MSSETAIVQQRSQQHPFSIMASTYGLDEKELFNTLCNTAMKGGRDGRKPTREEATAFAIVANQYGLNPFKREIHAFADPQRGGLVPIVGVDGWSKIVNSHPQFDGMDFEYENDKGNPIAVTCVMYVAGRTHPVRATEYLAECRRNTAPWQQMPRRMLRHKAFMQAARLAFSISGIYDEDEARDIIQARVVAAPQLTGSKADRLAGELGLLPEATDDEAVDELPHTSVEGQDDPIEEVGTDAPIDVTPEPVTTSRKKQKENA